MKSVQCSMIKNKQNIILFLLLTIFSTQVFALKQGAVNAVTESEVFSKWNKTERVYELQDSLTNGAYEKSIVEFQIFLDEYKHSYQYSFYKSYFPNVDEKFKNIEDSSLLLYNAVLKKNYSAVDTLRFRLLSNVTSWQNIEIASEKTVNDSYYSITIFFIIVLFCIVCVIVFYAAALTKSKLKQKETSEFSAIIQSTLENEKKRISLELHDSVAQDLRYTSILAGRLEEKKIASEIEQNQNKCIDEIRMICYALSPPDLDNADLDSAIKTLCSYFKRSTSIEIRLTIIEGTNLDFKKEQALNIYRIVQETLNNVAKHANAEEVTLLLRNSESNDSLCIFITDDGCGMDEDFIKNINRDFCKINSKDGKMHYGIRNIKERVQQLGGKVTFTSYPESGTEVAVTIPFNKN